MFNEARMGQGLDLSSTLDLVDEIAGSMTRLTLPLPKRAQAFDMEVHFYNPRSRPDVPYMRHDSLLSLAKKADFLVLTVPGGSVVDEQALIAALEAGEIAGAGLDVFEQEPEIPVALLNRDDVVITPHFASSTVETMAAMADLVFENLLAFSQGEAVLTRVV